MKCRNFSRLSLKIIFPTYPIFQTIPPLFFSFLLAVLFFAATGKLNFVSSLPPLMYKRNMLTFPFSFDVINKEKIFFLTFSRDLKIAWHSSSFCIIGCHWNNFEDLNRQFLHYNRVFHFSNITFFLFSNIPNILYQIWLSALMKSHLWNKF